MIFSHHRGHPIEFTHKKWRYSDNKKPIQNNERPCTRCGRMPTPEGYDACLGHLKGVTSACCGHGIHEKTIVYSFAKEKRTMKKVRWIDQPGVKDFIFNRDSKWIDEKACLGTPAYRGCAYEHRKSGRTTITYIGSTSKLTILWYNFILFVRWFNRRF